MEKVRPTVVAAGCCCCCCCQWRRRLSVYVSAHGGHF